MSTVTNSVGNVITQALQRAQRSFSSYTDWLKGPGFEFLYYPSCAQNVFFIYVLASICMALETKPNKKQQALGTSGPK